MIEFLIYQGKAAVMLAVFYLFYRLLLSKDTFHRLNRIVLIGTAVLSFILPCCVITLHKVISLPVVQPAFQLQESADMAAGNRVAQMADPLWQYTFCAIFALGVMIVLARSIMSIVKVTGIIRSGERKVLGNGVNLVIVQDNITPFSWMKYIVISKEDYERDCSQILVHEKAHIALKHSWDILLLDFISAVQWFNPVIWMLKADMRAIHEFEADDAVLQSGADIREYQYLLIKKAVGKSGHSVANSFNHSTLKQRITMMSNKKSTRMSAWKALYIVPLVGISLAATAETKVDYRYNQQQPVAMTDTLAFKVIKNNPPLYIQRFMWGEEKQLSKEELDKIDPNRISKVEVLKTAEVIEKYGEKGKNGVVVVTMKMPNEFNELEFISYYDNPDDECEFYIVEPTTVASFNGEGMEGFSKWLFTSLSRPEGCKHEGRMKVSFVVGTDGKVSKVKILESVCEELDKMVEATILKSPVWVPATVKGKAVPQAFTMPIVFKMSVR